MEKSQASPDPPPPNNSKDERTLALESERAYARARLAQWEEQREQAERERRAGRLKGELTHSLIQSLKNCNVLQLRNAKKLCHRYIKGQREAPSDRKCDKYTARVLSSVTVKRMRFRLEFNRTSLRSKKPSVNGPYVRQYWWDGSIVKSKYIKKDKDLRRNLPKKVWVAFRDLVDRPENKEIRQQLTEKLLREVETSS